MKLKSTKLTNNKNIKSFCTRCTISPQTPLLNSKAYGSKFLKSQFGAPQSLSPAEFEDKQRWVQMFCNQMFNYSADHPVMRKNLKYLEYIAARYSFEDIWNVYRYVKLLPLSERIKYKLNNQATRPKNLNVLYRRFADFLAYAQKYQARFNVKSGYPH